MKTKFEHVAQRKGHCSTRRDKRMFCFCSEFERCDYQQKSGESVMGCTVQGGQKGKEEQCK